MEDVQAWRVETITYADVDPSGLARGMMRLRMPGYKNMNGTLPLIPIKWTLREPSDLMFTYYMSLVTYITLGTGLV